LFQLCFVAHENGFAPALGRYWWLTVLRSRLKLNSGGEDDSVMLEAILIMLGLTSCALVLVAFWGSEVLGSEWRSRH
jgi:hypothetical protein